MAAVVSIHGENSDTPGERVFMGGLDEELGWLIGDALRAQAFAVCRHPDPGLQGREPENLCNRGRSKQGVQLELSRTARMAMFSSLSRESRRCRTARFYQFVEAVRGALRAACTVRAA
jgi:phage replication-related protein YjqB (UPF0714/DUF867 family)